jgi:short-subunit dehydrogenase
LAKQFASIGSKLVLSARREQELRRVAGLCSRAETVTALPLDLSSPELMAGAVKQALGVAGRVDVMVHNAGVSQRAFAADAGYSIDEALIRTNYLGPVALTKALLPSMQARQQGHFVVVSSVLGKFGLPGRSGYCASKHALHGFFDTLRAEVWKDGIRVTLVLPGWVRTNVSKNALTGGGAKHAKMDSGTANGMTPEECANRIIAAAASGRAEADIVRMPEKLALYLNRFSPGLFRRIIRGREL